jgi:hypothetical protein
VIYRRGELGLCLVSLMPVSSCRKRKLKQKSYAPLLMKRRRLQNLPRTKLARLDLVARFFAFDRLALGTNLMTIISGTFFLKSDSVASWLPKPLQVLPLLYSKTLVDD